MPRRFQGSAIHSGKGKAATVVRSRPAPILFHLVWLASGIVALVRALVGLAALLLLLLLIGVGFAAVLTGFAVLAFVIVAHDLILS